MNGKSWTAVPLPSFKNWAYDIREVSPCCEQVELYRESLLMYSAPIPSNDEKLLPTLYDVAAKMELDIQRKFCQRLYGIDSVKAECGILSDMSNENIRRFLAKHAVSLKQIGILNCGIRQKDISSLFEILRDSQCQVLAVESYRESPLVCCGEIWRIEDMRTPTLSSVKRNLLAVLRVLEGKQDAVKAMPIYTFVIDTRDVVEEEDLTTNETTS